MLDSLFKFIENHEKEVASLSTIDVVRALAHSTLLGIILVLSTYWIGRNLNKKALSTVFTSRDHLKEILGAMNLLFLTVGLCGLMILINNSIYRAFAIIAAIALVRFRVKLDNNNLGSSVVFSIIAGMSCGVNEWTLGYLSVITYLILIGIMMFIVHWIEDFDTYKNPVHTFEPVPTMNPSNSKVSEPELVN